MKPATELTKGKLLAKNTIWSFIGQIAPAFAAFLFIPIIITSMGTARYGLLQLAWTITGYFSLFDLGLGRALTQLISEKLGKEEHHNIDELIFTSTILMAAIGTVAGIFLATLAPWLITSLLNVPTHLQQEGIWSIYLLAFHMPFLIATSGLRGALEAVQRFDLVNLIRIPLGVISFAAPVLIFPFTKSLHIVILSLITVRIAGFFIHWHYLKKVFTQLTFKTKFQKLLIKRLTQFGGWMTASNIISPIMAQMDRFFIGSRLSMDQVAYYTTPFEAITKLWMVNGAIGGVTFPAMATANSSQRDEHTRTIYRKSIRYIYILILPAVLLLTLNAPDILRLWLKNEEFVTNSTVPFQILALGILINSVSNVPYTHIQAIGRPKITALFHIFELPIYLISLWIFVSKWGINGAAFAWTLRVTIDFLLLTIYSNKEIRALNPFTTTLITLFSFIGYCICFVSSTQTPITTKVVVSIIFSILYTTIVYKRFLEADEKNLLQIIFRKLLQRA